MVVIFHLFVYFHSYLIRERLFRVEAAAEVAQKEVVMGNEQSRERALLKWSISVELIQGQLWCHCSHRAAAAALMNGYSNAHTQSCADSFPSIPPCPPLNTRFSILLIRNFY